ncbi:MAG TPA: hypothetical protein VEG34_03620 [Thermoanaerobaculia bacterium]|nr:hypothetical protein [Thermoanaerobaculia bacterium]
MAAMARRAPFPALPPAALLLPALLLLSSCASGSQSPVPPIPEAVTGAAGDPADVAGTVLIDRVVAVIDEDPILASDLDRVVALRFYERQEGESEPAFRRRVLDLMIEDRLRFHELDRFGFEQVPVDEIERQVERIRQRFASPEELERQLAAHDTTIESLRQLVTRQLLVLNYVEERLGPRVFVTPEDIQAYYDRTLAPEAARHGQAPPPLDEVREQIRELLRQQKLNQEIDHWTEELRREADVANLFDREDRPLPPVVHRINEPPG